jgi:hypothetical protein
MMNGYKTYLVAILMAVFGVLAQADWTKFFDDPKTGWAVIASAVIMAIMRAITQATTVKQAIAEEPPKPVAPPAPAPKPVAKPTKPTPKKK